MKKLLTVVVAVLLPVVVLVGPAGADDSPAARPSRVALSTAPVVGATVTAVPGAWSQAPDRRAYEWLRDGEGEVIGREVTYPVGPEDAGHTLVVIERVWFGSVSDETSSVPVPVTERPDVLVDPAPAPAAAAPAVASPTVNTRRPTLTGSASVGKKLTVRSGGAWAPVPTSLTFQWLRNGKKISGATKTSYRLTSKDRGKKVSVRVSAARAGVPSVAATSKASRRVR